MKKQIRTVAGDIVQVTIADERWCLKPITNPITGLPDHQAVPSVTWITSKYPKSIGFYKWLADKGWDESEAIKQAAGDKGSKVHYAIGALLQGESVKISAPEIEGSKFLNPSSGQQEELTIEEYQCLLSFRDWFLETKPETIALELVVWNDEYGYAGTIDYLCKIDGVPYLIDFKTSQQVWPEHEMQVSAYKHALTPDPTTANLEYKLAILQVGYNRNKAGWKFTEVEDQFDLFIATQRIWSKEAEGQTVFKRDYPLVLTLTPPSPDTKPEPTRKPVKAAKKAA